MGALLVVVLVVAADVRLVNLGRMAGEPIVDYQRTWSEGDTSATWAWSDTILGGDVLCRDTPHPSTAWMATIAPPETWERWWGGKGVFHRAPLYPYLLAGMRRLAGDGFWGIALCQMALGLASVALVFLIAARCFDPTVATVAGLGAALYGPFLLHESLLLRDPLAVTTSLLALWALLRSRDAGRGGGLLAGVLLAVSLLAREANLLFAPLAVLWIARRHPQPARAASVFVAGVVLGLLPLVARNVAVGVAPWALSNGATERIVYGHAVDSKPVGFIVPKTAKPILERAEGHLGPAVRLTLATYEGDWGRLARNEATNLLAIVAGFEPADNVDWYYFADRSALLRWLPCFEMVLGAGLVGLWLARGTSARHDVLWWFLLASIPGLYAPVVARYRLVAVAVLLVYAAVAVVWTVRQVRARRVGPAAVAILVAVAVGVVSANLLGATAARLRYRATEFILGAQVYHARGDDDRALDELRDGLAKAYRGPEPRALPTGYFQMADDLATLSHLAGRDQESAATLERLALEYPQDADLQGLLAAVYRDRLGAADLAETHLALEQRLRATR
jgi:4-amino-4-deoxy-L-arabinose transferase-like glycosyltransferase